MRSLAVLLLLGSATLLGVKADAATVDDRTLPFGCSDVVVIGMVHSKGVTAVDNEQNVLGNALVIGTISVRKVVRGGKLPLVVPVSYAAHTYMREGREFMLVLRKADDGIFSIETGQLMSFRPKLAPRCE